MPVKSRLFSPLTLRGVTLKNRIVISPMCQYSAHDGYAEDWHLVHLGKFALGGAALILTEATAVEPRGRITHGDLGLWSDAHIPALKRISEFIKAHGAVPGMQLAHAGRKASMQRPWYGNGPLDDGDRARGEQVWDVVAPSALPMERGWLMPHELSIEEIGQLQQAWKKAALRALRAGFEVIELHSAHGYLGHEFLSPLSNQRTDRYGGDRRGRMRFTLELAELLRATWPADKPLFVRVSSVDGLEGGWTLEDTVVLAEELRALGVDVIDCSSGGLAGSATAAAAKRGLGFQVPYAERVKRATAATTMAVGLIVSPAQAEAILQAGQADLIAIGREALNDPNWPLHARAVLEGEGDYCDWPVQYGWWLERRHRALAQG